jgi:endonuclease/exonuclease/phosphatase (EEP) superfamily protein YafD
VRPENIDATAACYEVRMPWGPSVNVFGLHLSTPRFAFQETMHLSAMAPDALREIMSRLWFESDALSRAIKERPGPSLVMGDFNQPVESVVYHRNWSDWGNAFSEAGFGFGRTFIDRFSLRIDHVLHGPEWRTRRSWVGPDVGSQHRPVFAELEWIEGS